MSYLLVEEDEFEVEAGAEHEDVVEHFDLGDRARRQRVRHRHQANVLHGGSMEIRKVLYYFTVLIWDLTRALRQSCTWNEGGSRLIAWLSDEGDEGEAEGLCNCLTLRYPLQWITLYPAVVRPALRLASTHFILEIDRY